MHIAYTLARNLRQAILRVIRKWPELINLADFKNQIPLLLAARCSLPGTATLLWWMYKLLKRDNILAIIDVWNIMDMGNFAIE